MDLLRQILTILFLPIAIFVFMIGLNLQWMEQKQNKLRVKTPQIETVVKDGTTDERVEVKIIEDLMEKVPKAEKCANKITNEFPSKCPIYKDNLNSQISLCV
jgi:hypothetical protein